MAMTNGPRRNSSNSPMADINVTPLVDVMLVLLIVFMISAPLMQQGIQVDLPKANGQALDTPEEQLVLVVHRDRKLTINDNPISENSLSQKLVAIFQTRQNKELFIQADQNVNYGFVAQVMAEVKNAGIVKVGLVTDPKGPEVK